MKLSAIFLGVVRVNLLKQLSAIRTVMIPLSSRLLGSLHWKGFLESSDRLLDEFLKKSDSLQSTPV